MDVGNDPFPRDEVTGLAAFENLEPVSAVNVMPEPPPQQPVQAAAPARTFNRPIGVAPAPAAGSGGRETDRPDKTEILDLHQVETVSDDSDRGWEDDEATSILTPAAFRPAPASEVRAAAAAPARSLDMDWDEEEPPTRMRDDIPFLPPIGGGATRTAPGMGESGWERQDAIHDAVGGYDDLASAGYSGGYAHAELPAPAPPVGRPSPFPTANTSSQYLPPIAEPVADRGGAPSPFSSTTVRGPVAGLAGRPAWMLIAGGASVAVVLLFLGRALFGGSSDGSVTITTTPTDARVYVDGRPVAGTSSPFTATELKEGPHELVVQKDGFAEHRSTFNLEGGEVRALPAVALEAAKKEVGFAINSMPSGATILVDGATTGQTTPAKITGVTPGVHKLQLQLADHTPFELQVLVPDTGVLQLPIAELTAAPAVASNRKEAREPREPKEAREPREPREPREAREPRETKSRSRAADDEAVAERAEPAARSGGATGMLRLNSRPWSQVYVDGKLVGNTPQMGLPLSPGNHSVRLVNAQMGLTKTFSVSVKSGQMVTKVVNLVE